MIHVFFGMLEIRILLHMAACPHGEDHGSPTAIALPSSKLIWLAGNPPVPKGKIHIEMVDFQLILLMLQKSGKLTS